MLQCKLHVYICVLQKKLRKNLKNWYFQFHELIITEQNLCKTIYSRNYFHFHNYI